MTDDPVTITKNTAISAYFVLRMRLAEVKSPAAKAVINEAVDELGQALGIKRRPAEGE